MLSILKNNYNRMLKRFVPISLLTLVTIASIILAVYLSGSEKAEGKIAVINPNGSTTLNSKYLDVEVMKKEPPYSELVRQKYDAFVFDNGARGYRIITQKNNEFRNMLEDIMKNKKAKAVQDDQRGVGVNIIGFLMTFLLVGTFMNLFTYAEDREKGLLARISLTPVSFTGYLAANGLYCLSMFLPAYLAIVFTKLIGFNIGLSLLQYSILFLMLGMFGISFALLLNTLIKKSDNASLLGNTVLILSSILSGTFFPLSKGNRILEFIIKFLPQKQLLDFAQYLQNSNKLVHLPSLCYIAAFSSALFIMAYAMIRIKYVKKV